MKLVTLTFDRVFDLHQYPAGKYQKAHTLFSFSSNIGAQYGVSAPGWPKIETGMTITAVLGDPNNWQTLKGWINHDSHEIAVHGSGEMLVSAVFSFLASWLLYYMAFGSDAARAALDNEKVVTFFFFVFFCIGLFTTVAYIKQRKIHRILRNSLVANRHGQNDSKKME